MCVVVVVVVVGFFFTIKSSLGWGLVIARCYHMDT